MRHESFSEIFRYIGQSPKPTPEEAEKREKAIKEGQEDFKRQIQRLKKGIQLDGTRYPEEDLIKIRAMFGELEE
ncbi:hypothetical protein MmiHf6_06720 [Methanimicrococcus hongohii]|uniref:Uncharacterized protein n=1 Tax=Methanimicrococcus hongohii TaxID=3028295 RepID=A0AA96UZT5_9EURY|nr:hypothetical protein [Methanimicrococcus sp. Hf6]WNY23365.1 hypothetical protein MmiHf6_06720 [Methanimicrococcus sp. Hf6]